MVYADAHGDGDKNRHGGVAVELAGSTGWPLLRLYHPRSARTMAASLEFMVMLFLSWRDFLSYGDRRRCT